VIEAQWTQRESELAHERMEIRQMAVTFKQVGVGFAAALFPMICLIWKCLFESCWVW